jgi:hypothetical protein
MLLHIASYSNFNPSARNNLSSKEVTDSFNTCKKVRLYETYKDAKKYANSLWSFDDYSHKVAPVYQIEIKNEAWASRENKEDNFFTTDAKNCTVHQYEYREKWHDAKGEDKGIVQNIRDRLKL